ncbi:MAG: efflux RND transporter periplasmic adaptor subunit [Tepidisphaeraceae bacterium]
MKLRRAQSTTRWLLIAAVLGSAAVVGGYLVLNFLRPMVTVTNVVEGPVVAAFYSTGTVQPLREYPIRSNTAGIITEVTVDKGDRVTRGQPLAIVTDPALIYAANKAQAELTEKQLRAEEKTSPVLQEYDAKITAMADLLLIAQREYERLSDLRDQVAGSQTDLDRAMDRVKALWSEGEALKAQKAAKRLEMQREVEVAKAALDTAKWDLDQQTLRAPIDGVVLDRPIATGTRLAVNDPIMRTADVRPANLVIRAAVDEEDVAKVHVGQLVRMTLYAFPGEVFSGHVTRIYDQADPERRTFEVEVEQDERNERLLPGMTGELAFVEAEKQRAPVIPSQAVQDGAVWVVRGGRLVKVKANIGVKSVERAEVVSGLSPGDNVVISPVGTMPEGKLVRTRFMDPRTAAGLNKPPPIEQAFKGFSH